MVTYVRPCPIVEVTLELDKLVKMCSKDEIYSEVEIRKVPVFKMARDVMISPNPESDVQNYIKN